jgi:2-polyprenyl-3-methyl-5-hydroxy-6-metoxy-1,4-benzoquinol methylase
VIVGETVSGPSHNPFQSIPVMPLVAKFLGILVLDVGCGVGFVN